MIAEIVPITRLPSNLKSFSYLVPAKLAPDIKIGQIVKIPFRNQIISGLVSELKDQASTNESRPTKGIKLKSIIELSNLILSKKYLELINWLTNFYLVSTGLILKAILPEIPKRIIKPKRSKETKAKLELELSASQKKALEELDQTPNKISLFKFSRTDDRNKLYLGLAQKNLDQGKQILIIVPEIADLKKINELFDHYFDSNLTTVFAGNLAKNQYFNAWQDISTGQAKIIIGTRLAIFAPAPNLGLIIIDQENNSSLKQWDQNPRYHVRAVALKISELVGTKLLSSSETPSLETFYQAKLGNYHLIEIKNKFNRAELVDLKEEQRRGNRLELSDRLIEALNNCLAAKKQTFLFINRRGRATAVLCEDCGFIFHCPNCRLPLAYHAGEILKCHHCDFKTELSLFCPTCRNPEFKFIGTGTEKIEREIRKLYPQIKLLRIDQDNQIKKCLEGKAEQNKCSTINYDIIIGTQLALKLINWSKVGLAGIVSADTLLYLPDFRATERTYQVLTEIILNLSEQSTENKIIIQTAKPENPALRSLNQTDPAIFYESELAERKNFNYPPFSRLIKLIFQHSNEKKCLYESRRLWRELNKKIGSNKTIGLSLPLPIYTSQIRGRYRYQIILKFPDLAHLEHQAILKLVPPNWIIDIDPVSLL